MDGSRSGLAGYERRNRSLKGEDVKDVLVITMDAIDVTVVKADGD